ncbi:hypothetical protein RYH80_09140 [Halobaculum sp. MBLA0147]|uniref:DUF7112 family protein n=1 Tax=Halobaculum sp. MBLA0147 TaxID=3079934 RepID=UPI00352436B7
MADRIASDAPAVASHRTHLVRSGGTRLPALAVPDAAALAAGDRIRLVLDGDVCHARVEGGADGPVIRGAYDTGGDLAVIDGRDDSVAPADVPNRLVEWCRAADRERGDAVELDELDPGFHYGLRAPGERAVYDILDRPDTGLRDIARDLDG